MQWILKNLPLNYENEEYLRSAFDAILKSEESLQQIAGGPLEEAIGAYLGSGCSASIFIERSDGAKACLGIAVRGA